MKWTLLSSDDCIASYDRMQTKSEHLIQNKITDKNRKKSLNPVGANCVRPHDYREDNINGFCKKKKNTLRGL